VKRELTILAVMAAVFAGIYFLPVGWGRFDAAVGEAMHLARGYAREHVLLCLVPALFIAGAISTFLGSASVMKYLGARANKVVAYAVASVSGSVLAVCSCTVLPLFAGIYRMGAGIGPATAFLYSGPAINVLAVILTAGVLGPRLGVARAVGAVVFSVVIGLSMHLIFRRERPDQAAAGAQVPAADSARPMWQNAAVLATMIAALVSANWAASGQLTLGIRCCPEGATIEQYIEGKVVDTTDDHVTLRLPDGQVKTYPRTWIGEQRWMEGRAYRAIHRLRFVIAGLLAAGLAVMLIRWFGRGELGEWVGSSWAFAKQILPLLLIGVLVAGFLLGRGGRDGLIPSRYVKMLVGQSPDVFLLATGLGGGAWEATVRGAWGLWTNLFASIVGAAMYFATLTEVPIVEGLRGAGMADGPALALLLAGPALSLPNMVVIRSIIGTKKTVVYICLVVVMATISGLVYGALWR